MKKTILALLCVALITSCGTQNINNNSEVPKINLEATQKIQTNDISKLGLDKTWEIEGFSQPESVLVVPNHEYLYVSNVNGEEQAGYISKITKNGEIIESKWIDNIQTPTGMGYLDGKIYVANQKQIEVIDVESGKIVKTITSKAKSLNDISITDSGEIYISDLSSGSIYKIEGDEAVLWTQSEEFPTPNGVIVDGKDLIVGNVGSRLAMDLQPDELGGLYKVNLETKEIKLIEPSDKLGSVDGLDTYKDGYIFTDPMKGNVFYVSDNEKYLLDTLAGGIADMSINHETNEIYAPIMFENKVASFQLNENKWQRVTTKEQFLKKGADKFFGDAGGKSVAQSDGTIIGNFGGQELKGTWDWDGEYFSRTSTLGDIDLGHDDIVIHVTDSKMRLTLQKGTGMSVVYDAK